MTERARGQTFLRKRTILVRSLVGLSFLVLGTLAIAVPEARLARGTQQARACFIAYAEPRGETTPACGSAIHELLMPAYVPWTANRARYRIEEIGVRTAHLEYVEAAAGNPNRETLAHAVERMEHQATIVQNGSTRVTMTELGPAVGAPDIGREADEVGDRKTLLERGEQWFNWRVRLSTLRAALLEGDLAKTKALAKRYAVDDPHDPDIRSAVAAVLCMGPDLPKGAEMLAFIQDDRAARRYENLSRDYGEVRSMLTTCLAKRDLPPPPLPTNTQAGTADAVEERALLRLRYADTPAHEVSRTMALATITRLLDGGPRSPGARLTLLAAWLTAKTEPDPAQIVRFSKAKFDEDPFAPSLTMTALEWVMDHRPAPGDAEPAALLPGSTFVVAAGVVEELEKSLTESADKPSSEPSDSKKEANPVLVRELAKTRGALLLEAAASLTRDGRVDEALQAAVDATHVLGLSKTEHGLLRSNVFWLTGARDKALEALDVEGSLVHGANAEQSQLLAAVSVQESELAMSLGKTDRARQAARRAEQFANKAKDPSLYARAKWMLAALGEIKAPAPLKEDLTTPLPFPPMGFAQPTEPWRAGDQARQEALVDRALAPWVGLSTADAPLRRAGRWAAMQSRGDAPPWLSVHLFLASRLLDKNEGDQEVWLDALLAMDQRRYSLRSYAFARAEAARMRGDMAAATTWDERFRTLCKLAAEVQYYEFTRHLDI